MRLPVLMKATVWTLLFTVAAAVGKAMAIAVAPTAVYLSDSRPGQAITLYNPSTVPEEVEVGAFFGYPTTDPEGRVLLHVDSAGDDPRSAVPWIRALPRRLVVPPGERRTVRVLARPPADMGIGEYWARLVFTSRGQRVPVAGVPDSGDVRVGLDLEVRTVIAASFRRGQVRTGIRVEDFSPVIQGDSLVVRPNLVREGNAAYIGALAWRLEDGEGNEVASWTEQVAVYREYHRRYAYDVASLPAGSYRLTLRLSTEREDIDEADRLPTVPVEMDAEVIKP